MALAGFSASRALSTNDDKETCRPFQEGRDGFIMGEGGILVIESLESTNTWRTNLREIVGYGSTGDAYHITAPT